MTHLITSKVRANDVQLKRYTNIESKRKSSYFKFYLTTFPDLYVADGYTVTEGVYNADLSTLVYKLAISAAANR